MIGFIEYFIKNSRLNYAILFFLIFMGINSYVAIPKEIFPDAQLDQISVLGSYGGTSASVMDKMAVRDIEDELSNITGIKKTETTITPGAFAILLTLDESSNKEITLGRVKDAIALTRQYLPSDMNEPVARLLDKTRSLIKVAVSSATLPISQLTVIAQEVKTKIAKLEGISEVLIRGDSDEEVIIKIDSEAILAYGLGHEGVQKAIANLSYIFPIGNIEQKGKFAYISTSNGKADAKEYEESILEVDGKYIRLGDIATVTIEYPQTDTLATFNNKQTISLVVSKGTQGDSIVLSKKLQEYVRSIEPNYKDVNFYFYEDSSKPVRQRLDIIISNLMFGLILVFSAIGF